MCRSLRQDGYDVVYLVADNLPDEEIDGVRIVSIQTDLSCKLERLWKMKSKMYQKAVELDCDIYQFHDPELLSVGMKLKKLGKKVIFDSHEDVPMQILEKEIIPRGLHHIVSYLYSKYELHAVSKLDAVISARHTDEARFRARNNNVSIITNYPVLEERLELIGPRKTDTFSYAGGISTQWNHDIVVQALDSVNAKYDLLGPETDYLKSLHSLPAWGKVNYYGQVSHNKVREVLAQSMAGIVLLQYGTNTNWKQGNLANTKLFECMGAAIPIICTDFVIWREIIERYQCGICVQPRDLAAVVDAMKWMIDHPDEARAMGERGRVAVETEFNWKSQEKVLLQLYHGLS